MPSPRDPDPAAQVSHIRHIHSQCEYGSNKHYDGYELSGPRLNMIQNMIKPENMWMNRSQNTSSRHPFDWSPTGPETGPPNRHLKDIGVAGNQPLQHRLIHGEWTKKHLKQWDETKKTKQCMDPSILAGKALSTYLFLPERFDYALFMNNFCGFSGYLLLWTAWNES